MKKLLLVLLLALVAMPTYAEEGWYGSVGAGLMYVKGIKPSGVENQVMLATGQSASYSIKERTTYKSLALGRCFNDYFCMEAGYLWGAELDSKLTVTNPNTGTVNVGGVPVSLSSLPSNLILQREARVSATQVALVGKAPITDWFNVVGKLGAYEYRLKTTAKILLPQNMYLSEESEETGIIPMLSLGFDIKTSKYFSMRFEGQKTGKVKIASLSLVYQR